MWVLGPALTAALSVEGSGALAGARVLCPSVSLVLPFPGLCSRASLSSTGSSPCTGAPSTLHQVPSPLGLWKSTGRPGSLLFCASGLQKCSYFQTGWDGLSHPPAHSMEFFSLLCLCEEEAEMLLGWLFPLLGSHRVSSPISLVKDEGIQGLVKAAPL